MDTNEENDRLVKPSLMCNILSIILYAFFLIISMKRSNLNSSSLVTVGFFSLIPIIGICCTIIASKKKKHALTIVGYVIGLLFLEFDTFVIVAYIDKFVHLLNL